MEDLINKAIVLIPLGLIFLFVPFGWVIVALIILAAL